MMNYSVDADGIATVEWDLPGRSQNVMNGGSTEAWVTAMDKAISDPASKGIIVTSAKNDCMAGRDVEMLLAMDVAKQGSEGTG